MKGIWDEILGQETKAANEANISGFGINLERILSMRLSEFAKRNMAIEIYSEVLGRSFWLCFNELMALQVKEDYPDTVTYTVDEMRELIRLNPNTESLRSIHNVKSVFGNSRLIEKDKT